MPAISVIVPCYNEEKTIQKLLEAIYAQTTPHQELEIVIADGMSTDRTRERVGEFQVLHPELAIRIVDNPQRNIPSGLNQAIRAATGEFLVRLDAHSAPQPDYVQRCIEALQKGKGDNVGGRWDIQPGAQRWPAQAIAAAAAHPLGVGDAHYRYTEVAQQVDTVPFGAYRRSLIDRIGLYDETLLTNEDYEFNVRIRQAGGTIWLDPAIRSQYFARATFSDLARQYWRYGYWKARMLRRYPRTMRWRQAAPLALVLSLSGLGLMALFFAPARWLFMIELLFYTGVLSVVGLQAALKARGASFTNRLELIFGVPLAIAIMHLSWGSAFLWSLMRQ